MSIATAILAAQAKVAAAYTECNAKGATMPSAANQDLAHLDDTIASIPKRNEWGNTGTVDADGLTELGWDANDIAWLQKVCWWDAEDDNKWKVSDANKAFGPNGATPLTWSNLSTYAGNADIVFFPKLPARETIYESTYAINYSFPNLLAIPTDGWGYINFGDYAHQIQKMFPQIISLGDLNSVQHIIRYSQETFAIPNLRVKDFFRIRPASVSISIQSIRYWFRYTYRFLRVDFTELDFSVIIDNYDTFIYSGVEEVKINVWNYAGSDYNMFESAFALREVYVNKVETSWSFKRCPCLSTASILRIIQAEDATSPIIITLDATAYARATADADVTAALENHPNVSLFASA